MTLTSDGTAGAGEATHTFRNEGLYGATVEICDAANCGTGSIAVAVTNAAPAVDAPVGAPGAGELR